MSTFKLIFGWHWLDLESAMVGAWFLIFLSNPYFMVVLFREWMEIEGESYRLFQNCAKIPLIEKESH